MTSLNHSVFVLVAPNGPSKQKSDHSSVPITASEIGEAGAECLKEGAGLLHVHVRDEHGGHSLSPAHYQAALSELRSRVGNKMILQITTESCQRYRYKEQFACVYEVKPEAFSIALREALLEEEAYEPFKEFLSWSHQNKISPQYILYEPKEIQGLAELHRDGVIKERFPFVLFVVGKKHATVTQVYTLDDFLNEMQRVFPTPTLHWAVCGFGIDEHVVVERALQARGHIRVGFENNLWLKDGSKAESNASLLTDIRARHPGLKFMTAEEARGMLESAPEF